MIYVALLRGINIGGNNKINMQALKKCFESLGHGDVVTYINSGNVIFRSADSKASLSASISLAIEKTFGIAIKIVIRDKIDYQKMMAQIPDQCRNDDQMKCDILFLADSINSKAIIEQIPARQGVDDFRYIFGAVLSILARKDRGKSGLNKISSLPIYQNMTVRNINTTRKIYQIMQTL